MKLSLNWLKEYIKINVTPSEVAEKLTMAGFEVDEILYGENFSGVVVGKVLSVEKHPNADKLRIAKVDVGVEVLQIVCGATNLAEGQIVPVAIVGAKLGDFEISKASLRGVESFGMICSERELGLGDDHNGIMILEQGHKIGEIFTSKSGADTVLDVKVLANRPDCMGVVGLAREVSALLGCKLTFPNISNQKVKQKIDFKVKVENPELCPRYMAKIVLDATDGESPEWLKDRLLSCGVRPIGLLVDISNYVMLEYGQPLHFFDFDKLRENSDELTVRNALANEKITTLDGVERKLDQSNLVIANVKEPVAIAGVMGGLGTEVDENTTNILIEAAVFDKASIRRTSRKLGLRSEAVARFEKGISYNLPEVAIERAAQLLSDLAGGRLVDECFDVKNSSKSKAAISFSFSKLNSFLGTDINSKEIENVLKSLGFDIKTAGDNCKAVAPWWRVDIIEPVDIYEEVIRVIGYDKVPYTLPFNVNFIPKKNQKLELISELRNKMVSLGFYDTLTYSFVGLKDLESIGYKKEALYEISNPMVKEIAHLRPTLVTNILESLRYNQFLKESIRLFEIGKTFKKGVKSGLPVETTELVIGVIGGETWPISQPEAKEFYDIKGVVENIFSASKSLEFKASNLGFLAHGRQADILLGGEKVGYVGEISPQASRDFDIQKPTAIAVVDLDLVLNYNKIKSKFVPFSKYQHTIRDLSVLVSEDKSVSLIKDAVLNASDLISNVEVIDIYRNKKIDANTKSVSVRMVIQSQIKTLEEKEIDSAFGAAIKAVQKVGGNVRGVKE